MKDSEILLTCTRCGKKNKSDNMKYNKAMVLVCGECYEKQKAEALESTKKPTKQGEYKNYICAECRYKFISVFDCEETYFGEELNDSLADHIFVSNSYKVKQNFRSVVNDCSSINVLCSLVYRPDIHFTSEYMAINNKHLVTKKGISEGKVIYKHAFRNALLPIITILGLSIPGLVGGSVIFETIFGIPGMGQLSFQSIMTRDYPVVMGLLFITAILTLAGNLVADMCYALADPRIRVK